MLSILGKVTRWIIYLILALFLLAIGYLTYVLTSNAPTPLPPEEQAVLDQKILGQGEFRYRIRRDKLVVPEEITSTWSNVHGLTLAEDGSIYVTYSTWYGHDENTRALIKFDNNADFLGTLGTKDHAKGEPHGLDGRTEQDGKFYLYHTNNAGRFYKTDTDMNEIWSNNFPESLSMYERGFFNTMKDFYNWAYTNYNNNMIAIPSGYSPCNVAFNPNGKDIYMADCYSGSLVHKFNAENGEYKGLTFGGKGEEANLYNTPHGLIWDIREGRDQLLIADRGNNRLQYTDGDGKTLSVVTDPAIVEPCDFDIWKDYVLIPDLTGHLVVMDENNKVISKINVSEVIGAAGFPHPHDAIFLPNGDIAVGTWFNGSLTYWERLPAEEG
ncbi:hypothetical protein EOPP23_19345 [Endozoicomonas sp. OPT23]|uniref:hypothetical protein n=1 Tax=Endozoicomonas sp. OPT23 TaxID=2072845 RepID=UPI00129B4376|nr:hypothetical protein [Endozoicomonas sp. OPT23]MRI35125.1 hypothetical protein [Endozoicomonas sp. OPT23]